MHQIWKANLEWTKGQRSGKCPSSWCSSDNPMERTGWCSWSKNINPPCSIFALQNLSTATVLGKQVDFFFLEETAKFQNTNESFMQIEEVLESLHNVWSEKEEDGEWTGSCLQGSAGLQGINPIPQGHGHISQNHQESALCQLFSQLLEKSFSSHYHGHSAWIKISRSEATLGF